MIDWVFWNPSTHENPDLEESKKNSDTRSITFLQIHILVFLKGSFKTSFPKIAHIFPIFRALCLVNLFG